MLKMLNMAGIRCPVGFSEELIEVFKLKNISNRHRNRQKTENFSSFQSFYAIFVKFLIDFVQWNVENGSKVKIGGPVVFLKRSLRFSS